MWHDESGHTYTQTKLLGGFRFYNTEADFGSNPPLPLTGNNFILKVSSSTVSLVGEILANKFDKISNKVLASSAYNGRYDNEGASLPPVAVIKANPQSGQAPLTVNFNGTGSYDGDENGYAITGYSWEFGDGTSSTESKPQHTYNTVGIYQVTLTVTDNENKTGSETMAINVTPSSSKAIVQGKITDTITREPIEKALVIIFSENSCKRIKETDAQGFYKIEGLNPGTCAIIALKKKYYPKVKIAIILTAGETKTVDFQLRKFYNKRHYSYRRYNLNKKQIFK
jgi:PKD repeat protein